MKSISSSKVSEGISLLHMWVGITIHAASDSTYLRRARQTNARGCNRAAVFKGCGVEGHGEPDLMEGSG